MHDLGLSVNSRAAGLVADMTRHAAELKISISRGELGEMLIDAGSTCRGSIDAGVRLAEICMGGLGTVAIAPSSATPNWPWTLVVRSSNPIVACLASQYAGWKLAHGSGKGAFFALGSGPGRALARKETLFQELGYADRAENAVLVLESTSAPPPELMRAVARDCGVAPDHLQFLYAPTQSLAGTVQVIARVLEVALHKTHELKFPLDRVVEGLAAAPLAPPHPDFMHAMGRTNDAIIYGGRVHLFVRGPADEARQLADQLPSIRSRDYGRPFADIFASYNRDFYAIDPMLFAPAEVIVSAIDAGQSFRGGRVDLRLLDAAFS
jgi:methenyltetrahydromethanopterin cyclohydrolase